MCHTIMCMEIKCINVNHQMVINMWFIAINLHNIIVVGSTICYSLILRAQVCNSCLMLSWCWWWKQESDMVLMYVLSHLPQLWWSHYLYLHNYRDWEPFFLILEEIRIKNWSLPWLYLYYCFALAFLLARGIFF